VFSTVSCSAPNAESRADVLYLWHSSAADTNPPIKKNECIRHWRDVESPDDSTYPDSDERFSIGAPLARVLGLKHIGIHHERLPPGRRTSYPHAESDEEEFIYVLEGNSDAWINGYLSRLEPGDSVGFPAGTGVCHTFINNTDREVRLLVIGEANKRQNRIYYPLNPEYAATRQDRWIDHPPQFFGPHDGKARQK